jgi:hypothetical protein
LPVESSRASESARVTKQKLVPLRIQASDPLVGSRSVFRVFNGI